jgi:branched-chain amino acid transport system substrate-binding protein
VWAEAVEIAGSFGAASVADVLRSHEFETMFGTLGFDDKGDVTGAEMWSWYRWENRRMVEKAQAELAPTE